SYVYTAYQAVDRCQLALNDNRLDDGVFESRLAISKFPTMVSAWKLQGLAQLRSGNPKEAIHALTEAISLYQSMLQNVTLENARFVTHQNNNVYHLSECYRYRSEANAALNRPILAEEDRAAAERYLSFTQGRLIPSYTAR
ncbi:MAG: hypothetical protein R3C05_24695, partial [Pirellulaceae bacterium]